MGRKVFVSSDMSTDDRLLVVAEHSETAVLLWPWVLTAMDDWGRAEANARTLKARLFPALPSVTPAGVDEALRLYAEVGLLTLYTSGTKRYMAIDPEKWWRWQTHIRTEKRTRDESACPPPPAAQETPGAGRPGRQGSEEGASAQARANARSDARVLAAARICTPSPSPSPSPDLKPPVSPLPCLDGAAAPTDGADAPPCPGVDAEPEQRVSGASTPESPAPGLAEPPALEPRPDQAGAGSRPEGGPVRQEETTAIGRRRERPARALRAPSLLAAAPEESPVQERPVPGVSEERPALGTTEKRPVLGEVRGLSPSEESPVLESPVRKRRSRGKQDPEIAALVDAAYDVMKAAGQRPMDGKWWAKAYGKVKNLTPEARARLPDAVAYALRADAPGWAGVWLQRCNLADLCAQAAAAERSATPVDDGTQYRFDDPDELRKFGLLPNAEGGD